MKKKPTYLFPLALVVALVMGSVLGACASEGAPDNDEPDAPNPPADASTITVDQEDYPVQTSDAEPLEAGELSSEDIRYVFDLFFTPKSGMVPPTLALSRFGDRRIPAKELRRMREKRAYYGKPNYYCVYEDEEGGRLYVFLGVDERGSWVEAMAYVEKRLTFGDFLSLEAGVSDREDVMEIDRGETGRIAWFFEDHYGLGYEELPNKTVHITREGFVEISYSERDGSLTVEEVKTRESEMIASINENDLVAK